MLEFPTSSNSVKHYYKNFLFLYIPGSQKDVGILSYFFAILNRLNLAEERLI